jgi:hypothetical protein
MHQEYVSLTLPKRELEEFHRGLLQRFVAESLVRREQGLEESEYPESLSKLEEILGLSEERAHAMLHEAEDELWNYAWYVYTDEWAWHRAKADTVKELGKKSGALKREALDRLVEERYEKYFERYIREIDMKDEAEEIEPRKSRESKKK